LIGEIRTGIAIAILTAIGGYWAKSIGFGADASFSVGFLGGAVFVHCLAVR
jgi:hypothetical protein